MRIGRIKQSPALKPFLWPGRSSAEMDFGRSTSGDVPRNPDLASAHLLGDGQSRAWFALANELHEAHLREDERGGDVGWFVGKGEMGRDLIDRAGFNDCRIHLELTITIGIAFQVDDEDAG